MFQNVSIRFIRPKKTAERTQFPPVAQGPSLAENRVLGSQARPSPNKPNEARPALVESGLARTNPIPGAVRGAVGGPLGEPGDLAGVCRQSGQTGGRRPQAARPTRTPGGVGQTGVVPMKQPNSEGRSRMEPPIAQVQADRPRCSPAILLHGWFSFASSECVRSVSLRCLRRTSRLIPSVPFWGRDVTVIERLSVAQWRAGREPQGCGKRQS